MNTLNLFIMMLLFSKLEGEIVTECLTPEGGKGFCTNIQSCSSLIQNVTSLRTRRCGPRNEDRRRPKVCCEPSRIKMVKYGTPKRFMCGTQNYGLSSRILDGEETSLGEFPWMARLIRKNDDNELIFSCTGALVTPRAVLTVAHCLVSPELEELGYLYAVTLGEHETECGLNNNRCEDRRNFALLSKIIVHPDFDVDDRNHDNDIGLIILNREIKMSGKVVPICLLKKRFETDQYFISGWGKTEQGTLSSIKLKTSLPPFSWEQCVQKYRTIGIRVGKNQICAGGLKNQDSCKGDSGGPLMIQKNEKWYVAGLVSFGLGCGREGWPGIYTYIPNYIEWIISKLT